MRLDAHSMAGPSLEYDAYIFCAGVLYPKTILEQSEEEIKTSLDVNLLSVVKSCEHLMEKHRKARIIIIGSESGTKGSYDTTYWMCKAAIHSYIENKRLKHPEQQLVGIAPSIIEDTRMTQSRKDLEMVMYNKSKLPKGRLLQSAEVAELIYYLLFGDKGYLSNTVIDLSGGKRAVS